MRKRNTRVTVVGLVLLLSAVGVFFLMLAIAPRSNNPAEMMRTVGTVSGVVGGLALAMIVGGLLGKKEVR
jgi:protein-S-isoprenylcysteine O-methyltransferase Ste14